MRKIFLKCYRSKQKKSPKSELFIKINLHYARFFAGAVFFRAAGFFFFVLSREACSAAIKSVTLDGAVGCFSLAATVTLRPFSLRLNPLELFGIHQYIFRVQRPLLIDQLKEGQYRVLFERLTRHLEY